MQLPNLKIPKLIHSTSSEYNKLIEVYQVGDIRRLSVDGVVQSISHTAKSVERRFWGQVEGFVAENRPEARHILMFGLGGGTMLHLFAEDMPDAHITVIEIDSEMIRVAEEYFDLKKLTNVSILNEDVMRVMTDPTKYDLHISTFDVVVVDIFCGLKYPDLGSSGTFFAGIERLLRPEGLVVFNRIYIDDVKHEVDDFCESVEEQFINVGTKTVAGRTNSDNLLVYGEVEK
ncbi:fused MFS/spermidine synthase [candidate division WWE3 bacterium]|jgi:spermidine synthase|nr:fused MFS/spermidine synthase [candidate division WWE3 bacterium]MBT7349558.1 fused MFS/spermidine synthase [candidate division WWE3 bacterium]